MKSRCTHTPCVLASNLPRSKHSMGWASPRSPTSLPPLHWRSRSHRASSPTTSRQNSRNPALRQRARRRCPKENHCLPLRSPRHAPPGQSTWTSLAPTFAPHLPPRRRPRVCRGRRRLPLPQLHPSVPPPPPPTLTPTRQDRYWTRLHLPHSLDRRRGRMATLTGTTTLRQPWLRTRPSWLLANHSLCPPDRHRNVVVRPVIMRPPTTRCSTRRGD